MKPNKQVIDYVNDCVNKGMKNGACTILRWNKGFEEVTYAWRNTKRYGVEIQEAFKRHEKNNILYFKNAYYSNYGMNRGTNYIWNHGRRYYGYYAGEWENKWYKIDRKEWGTIYSTRLFTLADAIKMDESIKYCAWNGMDDFIEYIILYRKHPIAELLMKCGLTKMLNEKCLEYMENNKSFCKYLVRHKYDFLNSAFQTAKNCYKRGVEDVGEYLRLLEFKRSMSRDAYHGIEKRFHKYLNTIRLLEYLDENNMKNAWQHAPYNDYLKACEYLKLDLNDTKVLYPKEFMKYHDQYCELVARTKSEINKAKFQKVSTECKKYNWDEAYSIFVAEEPYDLFKEGEALNHCVGRMNYDKKQAEGESAIFFIRNPQEKEKPYVTLELSLKRYNVIQCYGYHDTIPDKEVLDFVSRWVNNIKEINKKEVVFC